MMLAQVIGRGEQNRGGSGRIAILTVRNNGRGDQELRKLVWKQWNRNKLTHLRNEDASLVTAHAEGDERLRRAATRCDGKDSPLSIRRWCPIPPLGCPREARKQIKTPYEGFS